MMEWSISIIETYRLKKLLFLYFTGMLLELETGRLRQLLEDKQLLKHCIDKAYVAISGTS